MKKAGEQRSGRHESLRYAFWREDPDQHLLTVDAKAGFMIKAEAKSAQ